MVRCSICIHADKEGIELSLQQGLSIRETAKKFLVNKNAVHAHQKRHMSLPFHDVQYGDFAALNERVQGLILRHTREVADLTKQVEYWKSIATQKVQVQQTSDLQTALAMLHLSDIPSREKLSQIKRDLSRAFHPDHNPALAKYMQNVNWAADVVAKHVGSG